jgi:hypothetical protein
MVAHIMRYQVQKYSTQMELEECVDLDFYQAPEIQAIYLLQNMKYTWLKYEHIS